MLNLSNYLNIKFKALSRKWFFKIWPFFLLTVLISCSSGGDTDPNQLFSVSGTTSGLLGTGLVLQNNSDDLLSITSEG